MREFPTGVTISDRMQTALVAAVKGIPWQTRWKQVYDGEYCPNCGMNRLAHYIWPERCSVTRKALDLPETIEQRVREVAIAAIDRHGEDRVLEGLQQDIINATRNNRVTEAMELEEAQELLARFIKYEKERKK